MLDPVADGVADEMEDWIHHPLDEELVDFGRVPGKLELDALLIVAREIEDARRAAEQAKPVPKPVPEPAPAVAEEAKPEDTTPAVAEENVTSLSSARHTK